MYTDLLARRNAYARQLAQMRDSGRIDPAEVARLRAAKAALDDQLDQRTGAGLTLRDLLSM